MATTEQEQQKAVALSHELELRTLVFHYSDGGTVTTEAPTEGGARRIADAVRPGDMPDRVDGPTS